MHFTSLLRIHTLAIGPYIRYPNMAKEDGITQNYPSVCITRKLPIHPKSLHTQENILTLSNLDRQCPLLMYIVFLHKPNDARNVSLDSVFCNLKAGLEETLSVWYPAAGRLNLNPEDGKLNLWCNGGGAVIAEATTHVKMSELGDLSQYSEFFETLVYKPSFKTDFSDMPLVVAQVTRFGCGGYSIGIGTSHSLFDGPSAYQFMCAWASNSNVNTNETIISRNNNNSERPIQPVHERGTLLATITNPNPNRATRAAAIDHLYQLIKQAVTDQMTSSGTDGVTAGGQNGNFGMSKPSFVLKTFEVSGEAIEELKKKVTGERLSEGFSCSSFEFLAAHLWKARSKALGLKKEAMVCLQFSVGIRKKVEPPLPQGFSGNAYVLGSVASTAGEVEELTLESIIHKIREAKKSISQDYVSAYMEALDGNGQNDHNLPPIKELTMVSDWTKMSFHKVGFINGEPADYVSPLCPPVPQVAYFMQSPNDMKGIHVRIGLLPQNLDDFSNYFMNGVM